MHVIKKQQKFDIRKVKHAVRKSAEEAGLNPGEVNQLSSKIAKEVLAFVKGKKSVKSESLRNLILKKLDKEDKRVSFAWRNYDRKKK